MGQWIAKYSGIYYGRIQQYLWNPSDLQREFSTLKEQYEKLKTENDDLRKQLRRQQNPMPKKQRPSTSKTQKAATSKKVKYIKIKKTIEDSFSEDRRITGEFTYTQSTATMNDCFDALKILDNLIDSDKRNIVLNSIHKGEVLRDLKGKTKQSGLLNVLRERGFSSVNYSLPYCNFLIRLHNFAEKHDNILKCALGLKFIHINFAILKQAFQELGW